MKNNGKSNGNFLGMVPLIAFLIIYFATGMFTGSFDNMPLLVGITIASGIALLLRKPAGVDGKKDKTTFDEMVTKYCVGAGEHTLILMVVIFVLAGAFYGVAGAMGAVTSVTNIGLTVLPPNMILPGLFLVSCVLSFSMGTSMGTVAAVTPIAVSIANSANINVALACGIAVGGAMFGDNLSFISDTTIAATRTQNVAMKDKFKANFIMVLPAVLFNAVLLVLQPVDTDKVRETIAATSSTSVFSSENIMKLIPYICIIILSLIGIHVIISMTISILAGVAVGVVQGSFTFLESFNIIHEGMTWMQDTAIIAVFVGGLVALMNYLGGIDWLLNVLTSRTKTAKGGELSIAALVSLLDIATTNNTISIIAAGPIAKDISEEFGIAPQRTASILDIFSSAFNGLLPYGGQLLAAGALAGISPAMIMPYNWYSLLMLVFGIIFILIGYPKFNNTKKTTVEKETVA